MKERRNIRVEQVKVQDAFFGRLQELVLHVAIPYQEKVLKDEIPVAEKSHAVENFRIAAGLSEGEFYGMVFQDSDVAKWLEGVAYSLAVRPDEELERRADEIIAVIEKAQQPDGYLNTYFTLKEPGRRWQNLQECHELYCAGHMMEAAAAYYEATGKDRLLKVMERMAEHIGRRFGPDKERGVPGHQEVELGLLSLYRVTGKEEYRSLARFFIEERGKNPDYFAQEKEKRGWTHFDMDPQDKEYCQCHATVYEQQDAVGHSVRAVYMYAAMAELAASYQDEALSRACVRLWESIVNKRMYLTGGIGSTAVGEAFTADYDLPNDTVYAETCASVGMVFFAKRMLALKPDGNYADIMERELYNGIISGMQQDGRRFFYVNPLEVNPGVSGVLPGYRHVLPERPDWYACSCCPPNVVRLLMSLGKYAWDESGDTIYSHLYIGQQAELEKASITVESGYPWEGRVRYSVRPRTDREFTLAVHVPSYIKELTAEVNHEKISVEELVRDGYLYLKREWKEGDTVELSFKLPVRRLYANQRVIKDAGCTALMRGPIVYCFEGVDNGERLQSLRLPENARAEAVMCSEGPLKGNIVLKLPGKRLNGDEALYSENPPRAEDAALTAVPYYTWGNRGLNQMRVWIQCEQSF